MTIRIAILQRIPPGSFYFSLRQDQENLERNLLESVFQSFFVANAIVIVMNVSSLKEF